jgi:hypothetical protein
MLPQGGALLFDTGANTREEAFASALSANGWSMLSEMYCAASGNVMNPSSCKIGMLRRTSATASASLVDHAGHGSPRFSQLIAVTTRSAVLKANRWFGPEKSSSVIMRPLSDAHPAAQMHRHGAGKPPQVLAGVNGGEHYRTS